jgi:hypothetical protein
VSRTLPQYSASDVLFEYYDARSTGHGLISLVALRGPVEDLPDRENAVGEPHEWTAEGTVQCSPLYVGKDIGQDRPVKGNGHVCWRTSGEFSASILTTSHSLEETKALVGEFWATQ